MPRRGFLMMGFLAPMQTSLLIPAIMDTTPITILFQMERVMGQVIAMKPIRLNNGLLKKEKDNATPITQKPFLIAAKKKLIWHIKQL